MPGYRSAHPGYQAGITSGAAAFRCLCPICYLRSVVPGVLCGKSPSREEHSRDGDTRVGNRLLAALPAADFDLLAPFLRKVSLNVTPCWCDRETSIEQIYFPLTGTIAFIRTCRTDKRWQPRSSGTTTP